MRRRARVGIAVGLLASLLAAGCARHVVVAREAGRIDSARSISTASDPAWSVEHEPGPGSGAESE